MVEIKTRKGVVNTYETNKVQLISADEYSATVNYAFNLNGETAIKLIEYGNIRYYKLSDINQLTLKN